MQRWAAAPLRMRKYQNRLWWICLIYAGLGALLALVLPENVAAWPGFFSQFVDFAADVFPSVRKFARVSHFPAVTMAYFAFMLSAGPLVVSAWIVLFPFDAYRIVCSRKTDTSPIGALAGVAACTLLLSLLYVFPGAPVELPALDERAPSVLALLSTYRESLAMLGGLWACVSIYVASVVLPLQAFKAHVLIAHHTT